MLTLVVTSIQGFAEANSLKRCNSALSDCQSANVSVTGNRDRVVFFLFDVGLYGRKRGNDISG